jgi:hypothetical protein
VYTFSTETHIMNYASIKSLLDYLDSKESEIKAMSEAIAAVDACKAENPKGCHRRNGLSRGDYSAQIKEEVKEDWKNHQEGVSIKAISKLRGITHGQVTKRFNKYKDIL